MENSSGLNNFAPSRLPPESPFKWTPPTYATVDDSNSKPSKRKIHHHRAPSDSVLLEDQPAWLDDLLNEPESPQRGHRRSSSDPTAYLDVATESFGIPANARPPWGSHPHPEGYLWHSKQNRAWNSYLFHSGSIQGPGLLDAPRTIGASSSSKKQDRDGSGGSSARNVCSNGRHSVPRSDAKRIKQQFAHRSRMKKLQYIADLERNVQILLAEGAEVSAQLEHFNQLNLVLGMENTALKQQLDGLSQEQILKHLEQSMLEKELGRLQFLFQQQQQMQQQMQQQQQRPMHPSYHRPSSQDLVSTFANLSV